MNAIRSGIWAGILATRPIHEGQKSPLPPVPDAE